MPLPLAARTHGHNGASARPFVFLHGMTFDRRMWDPVLDALPRWRRAVAVDLPGHGASAPLDRHDPEDVAAALHETLLGAGIEEPVLIGHSAGALLAAVYAAEYGAAAVVNVDMPVRVEPFAELVHALGPRLRGDFRATWRRFQESMHQSRVPLEMRVHLHQHATQRLVLSYWASLLDNPPERTVTWAEGVLDALRDIPYLALFGDEPADRDYIRARMPHAEIAVWPVGHHFPHLADPRRFAAAVGGFALLPEAASR